MVTKAGLAVSVIFLQTNKILYYLSVLLMEIYFYFSNEAIVVAIVW